MLKGINYFQSIPTPSAIFTDPGDTFKIYTTLWIEVESQSVRASYNQSENHILVTYPYGFSGIWSIGVVARDSIDQITLFVIRITISEWGQYAWSKCTSLQIKDWQKCENNYILNLINGDWVSILSIYNMISIRAIGMFMFFFLLIHFLVNTSLIRELVILK